MVVQCPNIMQSIICLWKHDIAPVVQDLHIGFLRRMSLWVMAIMLLLGLTACPVPEGLRVPMGDLPTLKPQTISEKLARVKSVAVLPFKLVQGESQGAEVVRRSFYNSLSSKKFQDVELYRVDTLLQSNHLASQEALDNATPQELTRLLGVDAVVYGEVTAYGRYAAVTASAVRVGLHATMRDGQDGSVLWELTHVNMDLGGGVPTLDPLAVVMKVISATMNVREIQLLRGADHLCRKMVNAIPGPTLSAALRPPAITALAQDTQGVPKKAGDEIKVVMIGDPGHRATFHLGTFRQDLPMVEAADTPGTYVGTYQVLPGDNVQGAIVEGHLIDERNNRSRRVDVFGSVTLDTEPPAVPAELRAVGRDEMIVLRWDSNPESDLAGYRLYRSDSPITGYALAQQVEETEVRDANLTNFEKYYYKVAAFDRANNESPHSAAVMGMPIKPGPTPVTGDITDDTTWYASASPYVLQQPVTVRTGVTLTIEPGVTVESAGPGLRIRGSLMATGNDKGLIVLRHAQPETETAFWEGITFDNTGKRQNRLDHVKIQDTKVAIRAISSSPEIRHAILTGNDIALLVTELSEPHIEANAITNNRQDGIISRNATPTIMRNDITHNAGNGITLAASSPVMLENNVHSNTGYQLLLDGTSEAIVSVQNNWWGTTDREQLQRLIAGPVSYAKVLDAPYPQGRPVALPSRAQATPAPVSIAPAAAPTASADELIAQGEAALQQDQPAEALSAFTQVLSLQPDNHKLIFRVGVIHYQLGQPTEAMQAMQQAAALQPDDSDYAYHLGLVYSELGMSAKAVAAWERVLAIRPDHRNARMLLALEQRNLSQ